MGKENLHEKINIEDYNYDLPVERISSHPLTKRDESKLLLYSNNECFDERFSNLPDLLNSNDLLIFNNTKVIRARIPFFKKTGAKIEVFCLEPHLPEDFQMNFESTKSCTWKCMVGNLKKWKNDTIESVINFSTEVVVLTATKKEKDEESVIIEFSWDNDNYSFAEILEESGIIPIPPYLNRQSEASDTVRYQTVYSKIKGSVAAPTAGLHFTDSVFQGLKAKGIQTEELTLHVSAGTFKPVSTESIFDHVMHNEHIYISKKLIEKLAEGNKRVIAVGTTSVRTLESIYWIGVKIKKGLIGNPEEIHINQWDAYNEDKIFTTKESLESILVYMDKHNIENLQASTQIIIIPGYNFKIIKGLITNFHMPKSTLLLLIAAISNGQWKYIYDFAINNNYRFLSYGDSSLILGEE